jgi:hypothetical protein
MPYILTAERERAREHPRTPGELNYATTMRILAAWKLKGTPLALSVLNGELRRLFYEYWGEKIRNYTTINDIYGATACAIMEFRRRVGPKSFGVEGIAMKGMLRAISKVVDEFYLDVAARYEDEKRQENGDVYSI